MNVIWVLVMFTITEQVTFGEYGNFNSIEVCNQVAENLTNEIEELSNASGKDIIAFDCIEGKNESSRSK